MSVSENKHHPDSPHRSFVPSDFSLLDIPGFLLSYILLSIISVVVGLVIQSSSPFWQGVALGIAIGMSAVIGMLLVLTRRTNN